MESMDQENAFLNSDDDDEELPDLFNSDDKTDKSQEKNEVILPGDIVWAEFRQLYWPSLVRQVLKKDRKISLWYLDSPRKCFKVPLKKVKKFSDPEISKSINKDVENSPMKALHRKVYLNAITFMRRKAEGCEDDPAAYFDLNEHYLTYKNVKVEEVGSDSQVNLEDDQEMTANDSEEEINSEEEDDTFGMEKKISQFYCLDDTDEVDEKTEEIVTCIKSGLVDQYLRLIKARKVPSEYQNIFDDAMKTDRRKLFTITACDIIKNLAKLREISVYLMDFYECIVEGGKCEMIDYIMHVWLPEAINKADQIIQGKNGDPESGTIRTLFDDGKIQQKKLRNQSKDREVRSPKKRAPKKSMKGRKKQKK